MTIETKKVQPLAEQLALAIVPVWRHDDCYKQQPLNCERVIKWLTPKLAAAISEQAKLVVTDESQVERYRVAIEELRADRDEWRAKAKRATATIASYHAQASHRKRKIGTPEEAEEKRKLIKNLKRQVEVLTNKLHAANMIASNLRVDNERLRRERATDGQ